jgi:beta-lactamase regulating signal transducer with metallopeptidase domain
MRPIFRLSLILLALFLAIAPAMTLAQAANTSGQSSTTTTTGPATTGGSSATAPNATTGTTTNKTTTTDTTTSNVPWLWIAVGAIVLIAIVGIVAANGRSETRIVR